MKTIINLIAGIVFLLNTGFANEINYKLNVTNITSTSDNTIEFDIYLMSSGEAKDELRYALGQYFLDVNPKFANSGTLTYSIVKSDLPDNMRPASITVSGNQLRMSVNQINSDSKSLPVIPSEKPGLLIARMKLETSAKSFSKEDFNLEWSGAENNFKTKIVAYTNNKMVEITDMKNHYMDLDNNAAKGVVEEEVASVPVEFSIEQNYPNPFNPSTTINYSIPSTQYTVLKIYDITGKEVATLVNENLSPGRYEVKFDGSNFASGVYFYKITAGSFSALKRMFLIK